MAEYKVTKHSLKFWITSLASLLLVRRRGSSDVLALVVSTSIVSSRASSDPRFSEGDIGYPELRLPVSPFETPHPITRHDMASCSCSAPKLAVGIAHLRGKHPRPRHTSYKYDCTTPLISLTGLQRNLESMWRGSERGANLEGQLCLALYTFLYGVHSRFRIARTNFGNADG